MAEKNKEKKPTIKTYQEWEVKLPPLKREEKKKRFSFNKGGMVKGSRDKYAKNC